jgi:hypothetical protein
VSSGLETVERAREFLERNGRVSLRALRREFDLDDDGLEELLDELVEIQQVAVREGRALAWALAQLERARLAQAKAMSRASSARSRSYSRFSGTSPKPCFDRVGRRASMGSRRSSM